MFPRSAFDPKRISMLFPRNGVVSAWWVMFALFVSLGPSMTLGTSVFVLLVGTLALTIMLTLWKTPSPTITEVLRDVDESRTA